MNAAALRLTRILFTVWVIAIALIVVPWWRFQDHSHWSRVGLVPFASPPFRPDDMIGNVALYLPFGYLHARLARRPGLWTTVLWAIGLSLATELTQVYSHGRFPSATDLVCNAAGAWGGARAWRAQRASQPR